MPEAKAHSDRKVKNYLIFGLLMLFVIIVFATTMVKMHGAAIEAQSEVKPLN